ncbi:MAG: NAD-binding protein [Nitriliruptorales bacterium]|nr:NAD-binding protein [Nitriliruptorales bacterium]
MGDAVGVIGLGNMGSAFAANLRQSGFDVVGYDRDPVRATALNDLGGRAVESAVAVAQAAPVVITSLPSSAALEAVAADLAGSAARDGVVLEMGTLAIAAKEAAAERLEGRFTVLDCPVSGTGTQALRGDIAVYASGDRRAYDRSLDVLRGFSRAQYYVGPFGTGMRIKFIANLLVTIHNVAAAEAITLARRAGLDLDTVLEVIGQGAGTSRMFEVRGPVMAGGTYADSTANIEIFKKDLGLISEFAADLDCPVPLLAMSAQLYAAAMGQGRGKQDGAAVAGVLAGLAGLGADAADGTVR